MKVELELNDEMVNWLMKHYGHPNVRFLMKTIIEERFNDCQIEEQKRNLKTKN